MSSSSIWKLLRATSIRRDLCFKRRSPRWSAVWMTSIWWTSWRTRISLRQIRRRASRNCRTESLNSTRSGAARMAFSRTRVTGRPGGQASQAKSESERKKKLRKGKKAWLSQSAAQTSWRSPRHSKDVCSMVISQLPRNSRPSPPKTSANRREPFSKLNQKIKLI